MKLLQINTYVNSGSTGRIAEDIGRIIIANGHESFIAYGRGNQPSQSKLLKIGTKRDIYLHGIKTLLTDRHGFGSRKSTETLIKQIDKIHPDAIGLHNLHGYYLNVKVLFNYLRNLTIPIYWTLYDCWAFTGHCAYFDDIRCEKWKIKCSNCPKTRKYPKAYLDDSQSNYQDKKQLFTGLSNVHLVVHSKWLKGLVQQSFLKEIPTHLIRSGVDLTQFRSQTTGKIRERYGLTTKKIILGVANIWDTRKGLVDLVKLHSLISSNHQLVLVGLSKKQIKNLPKGIEGISRTENIAELAALYSVAEVFVNPTWLDNFPTTNLEALACGTPVITYMTGGSPESIDANTGIAVPTGDIKGLWRAIKEITKKGKTHYQSHCRARAEELFNKEDRYKDYLQLFEQSIVRPNQIGIVKSSI